MNVFKIAWRSIQHRGLGSLLTVVSMGLGVMMVVAVLSIHGVVSKSFKNNNSFGYNVIVGARGGGMQLTLNTVYYLSQPVENIPYEYYLAFCDRETRQREMQHSFAAQSAEAEVFSLELTTAFDTPGGLGLIGNSILQDAYQHQQTSYMKSDEDGLYKTYTHIAIPLCLGDYWEVPDPGGDLRVTDPGDTALQNDTVVSAAAAAAANDKLADDQRPAEFEPILTNTNFRCVGTKPGFFEKLLIDIDTKINNQIDCLNCSARFDGTLQDGVDINCPNCQAKKEKLETARGRKFKFADGRCFKEFSEENGYFECVLGGAVAARSQAKIGDLIMPTHGVPKSANAHLHKENPFRVVGILEKTGTPHDRVVFLNMEGFFLIEDHIKPIRDESVLATSDDSDDEDSSGQVSAEDIANFDPFAFEESQTDAVEQQPEETDEPEISPEPRDESLTRIPLPIEQREVTSILVRTSLDDPYGMLAIFLPSQINEGDLENTLNWSAFRPVRSQKAAQAVNPVEQVTSLFQIFVDPVRYMLLFLTIMICVVSAISILVGIYNSMSQRKHEIAVIRALGASRTKVMSIMLIESILLALLAGILGWVAGHGLNVALSPMIEARSGVAIGFWDVAPGYPVFGYLFGGNSNLPEWLIQLSVSPELLLIPGLMILAVIVGIYPAVSAYKTDVSTSLGK